MKRILFVCSQNKLRSPTAEAVFADHPRLETLSAGTNNDAEIPLSIDLLEWADVVVAMESTHRNKIMKKFREHLTGKKVVVLNIPDDYDYMDDELVFILKNKLPRFVAI